MDHRQRYLESCHKPTGLKTTILDEGPDDEVSDSEKLDTSDIYPQTIEGAMGCQDIPKTSTPAKKVAAETDSHEEHENPERDTGVTECSTKGVAENGVEVGAKGDGNVDEGCCGEVASAAGQPSLTTHTPQQYYAVPEPIAEISSIDVQDTDTDCRNLSSSAGDLRNPDIRRPSEAVPIPGASASWNQDFSDVLDSVFKTAEGHEKLSKGYHSHCVQSNNRHTKSLESMRSLSDSFSSQQDEILALRRMMQFLMEDMRKLKGRLNFNQQTTSTHFIPYDSLQKQGQIPFALPTDDTLRGELFIQGFGSGNGTHLSLRITGYLPTRCRFEARVVNFDDEEETRKKSASSEETSGLHIVEFPKLIEKDVVENEALGYKRDGKLKIILIVTWDEVIDS